MPKVSLDKRVLLAGNHRLGGIFNGATDAETCSLFFLCSDMYGDILQYHIMISCKY